MPVDVNCTQHHKSPFAVFHLLAQCVHTITQKLLLDSGSIQKNGLDGPQKQSVILFQNSSLFSNKKLRASSVNQRLKLVPQLTAVNSARHRRRCHSESVIGSSHRQISRPRRAVRRQTSVAVGGVVQRRPLCADVRSLLAVHAPVPPPVIQPSAADIWVTGITSLLSS